MPNGETTSGDVVYIRHTRPDALISEVLEDSRFQALVDAGVFELRRTDDGFAKEWHHKLVCYVIEIKTKVKEKIDQIKMMLEAVLIKYSFLIVDGEETAKAIQASLSKRTSQRRARVVEEPATAVQLLAG